MSRCKYCSGFFMIYSSGYFFSENLNFASEMDARNTELDRMTNVLAEIAKTLVSNGANSTRTARNLKRIAQACGYRLEEFFSHSALILTVEDPKSGQKQTVTKTIGHYGVNYSVVSEISILSWEVQKKHLSPKQIEEELDEIRRMSVYPEWLKCAFIGIATAALAAVFDGTWQDFLIAFLAGVLGFLARKFVLEKKYNVNIGWFVGAFVSATVVNFFRSILDGDFHPALTACVLWLIPGVPLINGGLDVFGGHMVSGGAKLAMGFMLVFMIAVGFYLSLFVFGYGS